MSFNSCMLMPIKSVKFKVNIHFFSLSFRTSDVPPGSPAIQLRIRIVGIEYAGFVPCLCELKLKCLETGVSLLWQICHNKDTPVSRLYHTAHGILVTCFSSLLCQVSAAATDLQTQIKDFMALPVTDLKKLEKVRNLTQCQRDVTPVHLELELCLICIKPSIYDSTCISK